jgi:aminoglycoside 6'-N-acetyltransferase I
MARCGVDELNLPLLGDAAFLVRDENRLAVGFINLSMRTDYVPGAEQLPVAYVEGLYVVSTHQHKGIGWM